MKLFLKKNITLFRTILLPVTILMTAAVLLRVWVFAVGLENLPVIADEALITLQAKQIATGDLNLFVLANPYQFPLESYLLAPFVKLLPRATWAARIHALLLAIAGVCIGMTAILKSGSIKKTWPGIITMIFPSAFLLIIQLCYILPCHASSIFLWHLLILTAVFSQKQTKHKLIWTGVAGFLCGLSFSAHMLSVPVIMAIAAFFILAGSPKTALKQAPVFCALLIAGMLPYIIGEIKFPEANAAVTQRRSISEALKILPSAVSNTLSGTLGVSTPLRPGSKSRFILNTPGTKLMLSLYLGLLGWASVLSVAGFLKRSIRNKWPNLITLDVTVAAAWLSLLLFAINTRSQSNSYRYLLPLVAMLPFMIGFITAGAGKIGRWALAAFALITVLWNIPATTGTMNKWKGNNFALEEANLPDLQPAIDFLEMRDIRYCYASYWAAYRFNFATDQKILFSQPMNERFPYWPTPYKEEVDSATDVAYVLTEKIRFLKPSIFERHMRTMKVTSKKTECGHFSIYHEFYSLFSKSMVEPDQEDVLRSFNKQGEQSDLCYPVSSKLFDNQNLLRVEIVSSIPEKKTLTGIQLDFSSVRGNRNPVLTIEASKNNKWNIIAEVQPETLDKFVFKNGHPVYVVGLRRKTIWFDPITTANLRTNIKEKSSASWELTGITLLSTTPD